ncbi:unnamed protein product [Caenorhabditis bovis]|uniref:gamma-butyrobetaine dioxygenase n=1 Tax=Caenorhabditis bovis TaxID=2654633 RepID=A0A8S1F2A5_9PELO|nr:unnamed protein product [Caenorhabditis bovis]
MSREESPIYPPKGGFVSNDGFIWTDHQPDFELIEPPIMASVDCNYLQFTRNINRPPEKRKVRIVNHGDYPIAFKILTTDNYSYFVDQVYGVVPGRRMVLNPHCRMTNMIEINVFHRPYSCYPDEQQCKFHNTPRKDKMFILLAPYMCSTFSPAAIFHNDRAYEKMRIILHYTGTLSENSPKIRQLLLSGVPGWCTWQLAKKSNDEVCEMNEFLNMHKHIMDQYSKELEKKKKIMIQKNQEKKAAKLAKHNTLRTIKSSTSLVDHTAISAIGSNQSNLTQQKQFGFLKVLKMRSRDRGLKLSRIHKEHKERNLHNSGEKKIHKHQEAKKLSKIAKEAAPSSHKSHQVALMMKEETIAKKVAKQPMEIGKINSVILKPLKNYYEFQRKKNTKQLHSLELQRRLKVNHTTITLQYSIFLAYAHTKLKNLKEAIQTQKSEEVEMMKTQKSEESLSVMRMLTSQGSHVGVSILKKQKAAPKDQKTLTKQKSGDNLSLSKLSSVSGPCKNRLVTVKWQNGKTGIFPVIWLRDTSPDPETYSISAAMKARRLTMNTFDVEQGLQKIWIDPKDDCLKIEWDSGLISTYSSSWLDFRNPSNEEARKNRRKVYLFPEETWGRAEIEKKLKRFNHNDFMNDDRVAHDFLEAVCLDGIAILEGAEKHRRGAVDAIGNRIGMIKRTHFGNVFEVTTKEDASNMAYASSGTLPFHTDFPSMAHPPQLQMLHMLQTAETGGNSLFVDGFHVAEILRREKPDVFELLSKYSMEYIEEGYDVHEIDGKDFRYDYDMCARHKVIETDENGQVKKIFFGNAMRSWFYDCEPEKIQDIYRALKTFTDYCYHEKNVLKIRLENGDTVLWANQRLLHTRDSYKNATGKPRTLTGCYFDWDTVKSRVRQLRDKIDHPNNQPSA